MKLLPQGYGYVDLGVTFMVLPGNLPIGFSGRDIRHADGRQLQRLGIQPRKSRAKYSRGVASKVLHQQHRRR
jgi:hypothetical protein